MRGKVLAAQPLYLILGITPAYAGKSALCASGEDLLRDHPRVCGEKQHVVVTRVLGMGSPPRMRGKAAHWAKAVSAEGITPAYAGKSSAHRPSWSYAWDHPRVCGEKKISAKKLWTASGSPPRMRGKAALPPCRFCHVGITPAYAGKSLTIPNLYTRNRDHPRVCGEKMYPKNEVWFVTGSPPRMRGKATVL